MKGKTGKPTALRGGGMARKGTGSKSNPGAKKMAVGGPAGAGLPGGPQTRPFPRPGGPAMKKPMPERPGSLGGFASREGRAPGIRPMPGGSGMVRPGGPQIGLPKIGGPLITPGPQIGGPLPPAGGEYRVGMPAPGYSLTGMKKGGKVSKYAKGGAVKMTAGAGSGSGRLEKVAAHKSAKRVPAQNLKSGGKVKGK